jgi:hypothetical protein
MFVLLGITPAVPDVKIIEASLPVPPFALNESSEDPSGIPYRIITIPVPPVPPVKLV